MKKKLRKDLEQNLIKTIKSVLKKIDGTAEAKISGLVTKSAKALAKKFYKSVKLVAVPKVIKAAKKKSPVKKKTKTKK